MGSGLRDLVDLDTRPRNFALDEGFRPRLIVRAAELGLTRPLYYALRYAVHILGTPIPAQVLRDAEIGPAAVVAAARLDGRTFPADAAAGPRWRNLMAWPPLARGSV